MTGESLPPPSPRRRDDDPAVRVPARVTAEAPDVRPRAPTVTAAESPAPSTPPAATAPRPSAAWPAPAPSSSSPSSSPSGWPDLYRHGDRTESPPRSAAAIASLVLALLWACGAGSLAAIVLGVVGIRATRDGRRRGRGVAVAGLLIGVLGVLLTVGSVLVVWSVADETFIVQADERDDVRVVSCDRSPDDHGSARLAITNDSSETSSYLVTVRFRAGADQVLSELVTIAAVGSGEAREVVVRSVAPLAGDGDPECGLLFVQRYRAG